MPEMVSSEAGDNVASTAVFMFGYERSGTTLLSMMAGAHPQLAVPLSVTGLWYHYAGRLGDYGDLEQSSNLERLVGDLLQEERIKLWDESLGAADITAELELRSYPGVIAAFNRAYARKKGKSRWANLDIATLDDMDQAYRWFPDARFVHIVRDGRDVALSHETMPYGAANVLDCAQSWRRRLQTNFKMAGMLPPSQYTVIRYEDLVMNTEQTLTRLCHFLGLEYSPLMLQYTEMVDSKIPDDRRWLWPALDKEPQKSKCFGWKSRMDDKRRVIFEGEAAAMLDELGYETWSEPPKLYRAYAYELWCFLGRQGRMRRLARSLGLKQKSRLEKQWSRSDAS